MKREFRELFCKTYQLPIKVFDSPIFESRIESLDPIYGTFEKIKTFEKDIKKFKDIEHMMAEYNAFKERVIQNIKSKPGYDRLINGDMRAYTIPNLQAKKQHLYKPEHDGQYFLGFDLIQANFNAVKFFDPEILDLKDTYEDFISQFTNVQSFIDSKYVRQVIFGACNPGRQILIEKFLMYYVYQEIMKSYTNDDICHLSEDEIVLKVKEDKPLEERILAIAEKHGFKIRVEKYKLVKVSGCDAYFKVFKDNSFKLKCANPLVAPFIARAINDDPVEEYDKYFIYEGYLSVLKEHPQIYVPLLKY